VFKEKVFLQLKGWKDKDFRWFVNGMIILLMVWAIYTVFQGEDDALYFDTPAPIECPQGNEECSYG
jgi:hypothetical protein